MDLTPYNKMLYTLLNISMCYLHGCDDENGQSIDGIRVDGVGCNGGAGQ